MSKYALSRCWFCLCEVCTRIGCPKLNRRYRIDFCASMILRDRCPVVKCDYFHHKEKVRVYRIVRRSRKTDLLMEKLGEIEKGIDELRRRV